MVAVLDLALPDVQHAPSETANFCSRCLVSCPISLDLLSPETGMRLRYRGSLAPQVPVPETSVDENHASAPRKHNIGFSWKLIVMQPKAVSQPMENLPNGDLRRSVFPFNLRHDGASFFASEHVGHCSAFPRLFGYSFPRVRQITAAEHYRSSRQSDSGLIRGENGIV